MAANTQIDSGLIAASFLEPDNASRAIGALQDRGIRSGQISVATGRGQEEGHKQDGDNQDAVVLSDAPARPLNRDGFLEVEFTSPPVPTDMNAATDSRIGGSSTTGSPDSIVRAAGEHAITTTTPADAARGAAEGSVVGLGIGLLAGATALFLPGIGPILAAGPLFIALAGVAGATAAGAAAGGVAGYLCDRGIPAHAADYHAQRLSVGSVVVTVHLTSDTDAGTVKDVLHKYGGSDVVAFPMSAG